MYFNIFKSKLCKIVGLAFSGSYRSISNFDYLNSNGDNFNRSTSVHSIRIVVIQRCNTALYIYPEHFCDGTGSTGTPIWSHCGYIAIHTNRGVCASPTSTAALTGSNDLTLLNPISLLFFENLYNLIKNYACKLRNYEENSLQL